MFCLFDMKGKTIIILPMYVSCEVKASPIPKVFRCNVNKLEISSMILKKEIFSICFFAVIFLALYLRGKLTSVRFLLRMR